MVNRPLSIMVGSNVPNEPLVTEPTPDANVVQIRLLLLSSLAKLYSSCQSPLLTEPMTCVGWVTLLAAVGEMISTVGGGISSLTVIVRSSLVLNEPSVAVRRNT